MKNCFLILALIFSSLFASPQSQKPATPVTVAKWQEDIRYFKEQLVKRHKNAFHHVSKEEFESDIERLFNDIPSLNDYQVIVRLMQITAKVGDGHTAVHLPTTFKRYPIVLTWFGDSLYVNAATAEYKAVLGTRLIKIGDFSLEEVNKKIALVLSQDENKWFDMNTGAAFMTIPEVLVTLGVTPDYDHASFTFSDSNNREIKMDIVPVAIGPNIPFQSASKSQPLFRQKLNEPFWFTYLEDINAVYVNFKKYDDLNRNAKELFDFIEEKKATRLIVDLRFNGGGDFKKGRRLLISRIKDNGQINQKGNLFVITGRRTFSAAMVNSIDFKKETNAIILGEPPGERPNSYSENDEMKLLIRD